jgi:two-component system, NarL family, nitrate/nitrite response regulator NarL
MELVMKVLVSDRDRIVRELIRPYVLQLSGDVLVSDSGFFDSTLSMIDDSVDLCLIDTAMPGIPSNPIRVLKGRSPNTHLVVFSSICDPSAIVEAIREGASGYIPKSMGVEAVLAILGLVLAGELYIPSFMAIKPGIVATSPDTLTPRERSIVRLLPYGLSNKAIAKKLEITEVTVKTHLASAFRKMGVKNRLQASHAWSSWN